MIFAVPVCSLADASDNDDMSFRFELTVNGNESASVEPGGEVSVEASLKRTDSSEGFPMYAVQYDIWYNSDIFELIADSLSGGSQNMRVSTRSLEGGRDGWSCVSASKYSSALEGDEWNNEETVVSFTLKAKKVGSATLQSKTYSVSRTDGMSSYTSSANDAVISVENESNGSGASDDDKKADDKSDTTGGGSASAGGGGSAGAVTKPDNSSEKSNDNASDVLSLSERFSDIPAGAWYESAVSYALERGLFSGTSERTFSPEGTMTRAMLVTVLWRMDGSPEAVSEDKFSDVINGSWYADAVAWASANDIVNGYGGGVFGVNDSITRQQLAAVLYRYASLKGVDTSAAADISAYADAKAVAAWAETPMSWSVAKGIITGSGEKTLAPAGAATRAQTAAILTRFTDVE